LLLEPVILTSPGFEASDLITKINLGPPGLIESLFNLRSRLLVSKVVVDTVLLLPEQVMWAVLGGLYLLIILGGRDEINDTLGLFNFPE
jgi:hypothetical protein